jgi:hypothetical protein
MMNTKCLVLDVACDGGVRDFLPSISRRENSLRLEDELSSSFGWWSFSRSVVVMRNYQVPKSCTCLLIDQLSVHYKYGDRCLVPRT